MHTKELKKQAVTAGQFTIVSESGEADPDVEAKIQARQDAKKAKDFAKADAIRDELPQLRAVLTFGDAADAGGGDGHITPGSARPGDCETLAAYRRADPNDPNDCVTICWTSGTEARPKGVPRNHNEWLIVGRTWSRPAVCSLARSS